MNLVDIRCGRCGAIIRVNSELPKCMCQYCGNEIILDWNIPAQQVQNPTQNPMTGQQAPAHPIQNPMPAQNQQPVPVLVQDYDERQADIYKAEQYKKSLKMNMILCIAAFIARFIFMHNIILSFIIVVLLSFLSLKDSIELMRYRKPLEKYGVQSGNIVGLFVLVIIDLLFWCPLLVSQFNSVMFD